MVYQLSVESLTAETSEPRIKVNNQFDVDPFANNRLQRLFNTISNNFSVNFLRLLKITEQIEKEESFYYKISLPFFIKLLDFIKQQLVLQYAGVIDN